MTTCTALPSAISDMNTMRLDTLTEDRPAACTMTLSTETVWPRPGYYHLRLALYDRNHYLRRLHIKHSYTYYTIYVHIFTCISILHSAPYLISIITTIVFWISIWSFCRSFAFQASVHISALGNFKGVHSDPNYSLVCKKDFCLLTQNVT